MEKNQVLRLLVSVFVCEMAGIIGSFFTAPSIPTWYASLSKPAFTPPNWLFAPVWTTLFLLMGISLYLIWEKRGTEAEMKAALYVFGAQLILNVLWSLLFFGLQNPFLAFVEVVILWIAILANIIVFYRIDRNAGLLLIPYIAWVTIAAFLNYGVWVLNI